MTSKIAFIGGDIRMPEAAKYSALKYENVFIYGFEKYKYSYDSFKIKQGKSLKDTLCGADAVIFGLPCTADGINIYAPYSDNLIPINEVFSLVKKDALIFGGLLNGAVTEKAAEQKVKCFDYFLREELILKNALITAEGALSVAMKETPYTIHSSRCLVIGYGRIGKMLSDMLHKLNAKVSASARKKSDMALIECSGINSIKTSEIEKNLKDYDIIFNTVPACIFTKNILEKVRDDTLIIDLSSKPGGAGFLFG